MADESNESKVLTKEIAEQFLADPDSVDLREFTTLEGDAAKILSKYEGRLELNGINRMSHGAAEHLSKHQGELKVLVKYAAFTGEMDIQGLFITTLTSYTEGVNKNGRLFMYVADHSSMEWNVADIVQIRSIDQGLIEKLASIFGEIICGENVFEGAIVSDDSREVEEPDHVNDSTCLDLPAVQVMADLEENAGNGGTSKDDDKKYTEQREEHLDGGPREARVDPPGTITNSIGMKLVPISKGTFKMGSPPSTGWLPEFDRNILRGERQHEVTISQDYFLGAFLVTQAQYKQVMGYNLSHFQGDKVRGVDCSNHPVENVDWEDAVKFCERLSKLRAEKKAGRVYRLPTEAEWEYACRAGSETAFSFGESSDLIGDYAWYAGNSKEETHPVGEKKPNAWGLYDMHGNLYEWCSDWHGDYPKGAVSDPLGQRPKEGLKHYMNHVCRGGCWKSVPEDCRSARRANSGTFRYNTQGMRVAMSITDISKSPKCR